MRALKIYGTLTTQKAHKQYSATAFTARPYFIMHHSRLRVKQLVAPSCGTEINFSLSLSLSLRPFLLVNLIRMSPSVSVTPLGVNE